MNVALWGTRGSVPTPGPETVRYGGNTSCVEVRALDGHVVILDAGSGITRLGGTIGPETTRIDILLTHLHMDHIQGLGFFVPLFRPDIEVHIWGPGSATLHLQQRLMRYLSPPLFPVHLSELPNIKFHQVPVGECDIGEFSVCSALVCHPGPTVGYRVTDPKGGVLVYLPDHEPALAALTFPALPREWTSGGTLAQGADLLIHDSQYSSGEYPGHCGWGHSSFDHALDFGSLCEVRELVSFHHDPDHTDAQIDLMMDRAREARNPGYKVTPGMEGAAFQV